MDSITNCLRHPGYPDKRTAQAALRGMSARRRARGEKIVGNPAAFRCKVCGQWHVGRRNGRRGR